MQLENGVITEGKTKIVQPHPTDPKLAIFVAKNDITAGDGAKHEVIPGKGVLATRTTSNVFRLLAAAGVPVAFREQDSPTSFVAERCAMVPLEVVVRRAAYGSYPKRHRNVPNGHVFPKLLVEFFLKTTGGKWDGMDLTCNDPFIRFDGERALLFHPARPMADGLEICTIDARKLGTEAGLRMMGESAKHAFLVLEKAWQLEGLELVDCKVEFGKNGKGNTVLADVIDNDSWRVLENGKHLDKQVFRDGGTLNEVAACYRRIADLTDRFSIPRQRIILWCGSPRDSTKAFDDTLLTMNLPGSPRILEKVMISMHKEPRRGLRTLESLLQEVPDSVIITYVGRSNGAGTTLAPHATVPVIAVPATANEFPDDIWSSLRTPSGNPLMTVLDPANALLAALQILAMRNPELYAALRLKQEARFENVIAIEA